MMVEVDRPAGVVTKRADTAAEADRLRREAAALKLARHPGIAEFLGLQDDPVDPVTLRVRAVPGQSLARLTDGDARLGDGGVAGLGVVVATTLADLHDLGLVHGSVSADHILVDDRGQPVLCGLGRGRLPGDTAGPTSADDVAALAATLLGCAWSAAGGRPDPLRRLLTRASRPGRHGSPTARKMAVQLTHMPAAGAPGLHRHTRRTLVAAATAVSGVVAVAVAAYLVQPAAHAGPPTAGGLAPPCPPVDLGCRPLPHATGTLATGDGRYLIGTADDPVVIGRWRCARPLPALLQPATGNLWAFDQWPVAGAKLTGRLVAHIDGALSLTVDPTPAGCDRLLVSRRDGPAVGVDPSK